jgi:cytoskeleton protein RodZ
LASRFLTKSKREESGKVEALGQRLKQTRIERGIELAEIQEHTKIRTRYLEAIEEGKWDQLPGQVYVKGFIRSYAEYLGLDSHALLEQYGLVNHPPTPTQDPVSSTPVQRRVSKSVSARKKKRLQERTVWPQFAAGAGILAVIIVGYVVFSHGASGSHNDSSANHSNSVGPSAAADSGKEQVKAQPTPAAQKPVVQKPAPPPKPAALIKPIQNTTLNSTFAVSNVDKISVQMSTPNGKCWVSVTADGKDVYSGILEQGTAQSWSADKTLRIVAGLSAAIKLETNGQNVPVVDYKGPHKYTFQLQ